MADSVALPEVESFGSTLAEVQAILISTETLILDPALITRMRQAKLSLINWMGRTES